MAVPSGDGTGSRLRAWREKRGLTLQDVAAKLGWSIATVWRYEKGQSSPSADSLGELAELYGCHESDFFEPKRRRRAS